MDAQEATRTFKQAEALFVSRQYDRALELLGALNSAFPNNRNVLYPMAKTLAELGRTAEARSICDILIAKDNYGPAAELKGRLSTCVAPPIPVDSSTGARSQDRPCPAGDNDFIRTDLASLMQYPGSGDSTLVMEAPPLNTRGLNLLRYFSLVISVVPIILMPLAPPMVVPFLLLNAFLVSRLLNYPGVTGYSGWLWVLGAAFPTLNMIITFYLALAVVVPRPLRYRIQLLGDTEPNIPNMCVISGEPAERTATLHHVAYRVLAAGPYSEWSSRHHVLRLPFSNEGYRTFTRRKSYSRTVFQRGLIITHYVPLLPVDVMWLMLYVACFSWWIGLIDILRGAYAMAKLHAMDCSPGTNRLDFSVSSRDFAEAFAAMNPAAVIRAYYVG